MKIKNKRYTSVLEMIEDTGNKKLVKDFKKLQNDRRVSRKLVLLRIEKQLTEEDFAKASKTSLKRINRIESSLDVKLTLSDLKVYSDTLEFRISDLLRDLGL